jgi:two-component system chemotaxis sensor kinase CheA
VQFNPANTFLHEAEDLLSEIEQSALHLAEERPSPEIVHQLFRAFHTIKGSGAMCGFQEVAEFAHHVESVLDRVREGALPASAELAGLVLKSKDEIQALLSGSQVSAAESSASRKSLISRLEDLSGQRAAARGPADDPGVEGPVPEGPEQNWRIVFRPGPNLLANGGNPALLIKSLRKLGECSICAHTDRIPPLEEIEPHTCYLWWTVTLRTSAGRDAIQDVFLFVEEESHMEIELDGHGTEQSHPVVPGALAAEDEPSRTPALPEPPKTKGDQPRKALSPESTVRVPAGRLDRLVTLVGELVMNQSRLVQAASRCGDAELAGPVEEIERLVAELRDNVLGIRMMPIGTIFGRFRRLVHDLSAELGKEIDLITEGAETELDKSILDQLGEPLVHLLRNSIDHGIEPPERRVSAGKPRRGTIRLAAVHTGSDVVVSVSDDGRGLDRAAIRAKAAEKQLISPEASLSDKDLLNLILLPGFSTARDVSNVSGRGVGMDAVKRQIDAMRGSLLITSEPGQGSLFSLTLPLTLAIIEGLLVQVGKEQFIIPMAAVAENVELPRAQRLRNNGRNVTALRGELVPYIDLREEFRIAGQAPPIEKIVIVRHEDQRVGLVVDRVLGTHQTVIQSLGRFFRKIDVVSGATIMGDGGVALILDASAVVRFGDRRSQAAGPIRIPLVPDSGARRVAFVETDK